MHNQVTDLLRHDSIVTTEAKAKELRPIAEKVITLGKRGDGKSRRRAQSVLNDDSVLRRLFDEVGPRFRDRPGGYTRITKLGPRLGDGARMAQIELVEGPVQETIMEAASADEAAAPAEDTAAAVAAPEDDAAPEDNAPQDNAPQDDAPQDDAAAPDAGASDTPEDDAGDPAGDAESDESEDAKEDA